MAWKWMAPRFWNSATLPKETRAVSRAALVWVRPARAAISRRSRLAKRCQKLSCVVVEQHRPRVVVGVRDRARPQGAGRVCLRVPDAAAAPAGSGRLCTGPKRRRGEGGEDARVSPHP